MAGLDTEQNDALAAGTCGTAGLGSPEQCDP